MSATIIGSNITTVADLNQALALAATQTSGVFEIDLGLDANIALTSALQAITLHDGVTLTIQGNGATLNGQDGDGTSYDQRGLFVESGDVTIAHLTIANTVTTGGSGIAGGGGGAGLGGGLFIAAAGHVVLDDVGFSGTGATGGNGGAGPGANATFDVSTLPNNLFGVPTFPVNPFANGALLALGAYRAALGGGDLFGRTAGYTADATNSYSDVFYGAPGDFGGGGQGNIGGGNGGFGGGGGSGVSDLPVPTSFSIAGYTFTQTSLLTYGAGTGGYGAGAGSLAPLGSNDNGGGGGGLGAGGAIFVQDGGSLAITNSSVGDGHVAGGIGANGAGNGSSEGGSIFIQGDTVLKLGTGQDVGDVTTIIGSIAGERSYVTAINDPVYDLLRAQFLAQGVSLEYLLLVYTPVTTTSLVEKGTLQIDGLGTVVLRGVNQLGDIVLQSGILELGQNASSGHADVEFEGDAVQLTLDEAVAAGTSTAFAGTFYDLSIGDRIDLRWLGYSAFVSTDVVGNVLSVSDGTTTETFTLGNAATFVASDDGHGGTLLTVDSASFLPFGSGSIINLAGGETRILGANLQAGQRTTIRAEIDDPEKIRIEASLAFNTPAGIRASLLPYPGGALTIQGHGTVVLTANSFYHGATTVQSGTLQVDGSILYSAVAVHDGATLTGRGTTGPVTVDAGGILAPGRGVGHISVGGLTLNAGAIFQAQIGGGASGGNSDEVLVDGTVSLTGATLDLDLLNGADLSGVTALTLIDNDGFDPVVGTFAGLAPGTAVTLGSRTYYIYYNGGDGNDVVLGGLRSEISLGDYEIRAFGTGLAAGQTLTVANAINDSSSPIILATGPYPHPEFVHDGLVRLGFAFGSIVIEGQGTVRLTGTSLYAGTTTVASGTLLVDGSIVYSPTVEVQSGATLGGQGAVSGIIVDTGGTLAPGDYGAGVLTTSSATFQSGATFNVEIGGATPGSGYDQLISTGPVMLAGATLNVSAIDDFKPSAGQIFSIISLPGNFVVDRFVDAAGNTIEDGSTVWVNGVALTINYTYYSEYPVYNVALLAEASGPTSIAIDHAAVDENSARGTAIGTLTAVDPDNARFTYTLVPGHNAGGLFAIGGALHDQIVVAKGALLDYEQTQSYTVQVEVTDGGGYSFTRDITIAIGDVAVERATGNAQANVLYGGGGDDRLLGGGGDDQLFGGDGADFLNGGPGADTLTGGDADDVYLIDSSDDVVIELPGGGIDTVSSAVLSLDLAAYANVENIRLKGLSAVDGRGNDDANILAGNAGANHLSGLGGNDRLVGGDGDDILEGGAGKDLLAGGAGSDTFLFSVLTDSPLTGYDRIKDFTAGDRIDLSAIDADGDVTSGIIPFTLDAPGDVSFATGHISQTIVGTSLILAFNTDHDAAAEMKIVLLDHPAALTASDFVF